MSMLNEVFTVRGKKRTSNDILRKNIKQLRIDSGYTQGKIAEVLGVEEKHYSSLENGRYNFTLKNLDILSELFNKPSWELLKDDCCYDSKNDKEK